MDAGPGKYGSGGLFCIALIAIQDFPSSSASSHHRPDKGKGNTADPESISQHLVGAGHDHEHTKTAQPCAAAFRRPQYTHMLSVGHVVRTCDLLKDWHCSMRASDRPGLFPCMAGPPARAANLLSSTGCPGQHAHDAGPGLWFPQARSSHYLHLTRLDTTRDKPTWRCWPALGRTACIVIHSAHQFEVSHEDKFGSS